MREQSFSDWLVRETASCRMALIGLYEKRDDLLYVEAPPLRKRYMETIGEYETSVLQAELDVSLLEQKIELIQIAVNRREPISLDQIDAKLESEKRRKLAGLEENDLTLNELPQLSEQEAHTLQRRYREIIETFHPAMNADITDTQKELYAKAVEAYKMQDLNAMKLIYDMLFAPGELNDRSALFQNEETAPAGKRAQYHAIATAFTTDYSLAKRLYACFAPLEEDRVLLDNLESYKSQQQEIEKEIEIIRNSFPFIAVPTMNDPKKTEEYLAELRLREKRACEAKAELENRIASLTEGYRIG